MKLPGLSLLRLFCLVALTMSAPSFAAQGWTVPAAIEIVEVKMVGVSAAEESKSIIQVKWRAESQVGAEVKTFDVAIEVSYADGATERRRTTTGAAARSTRFEVPTLHFSQGRPASELRSFNASVVASFTEKATKQGPF